MKPLLLAVSCALVCACGGVYAQGVYGAPASGPVRANAAERLDKGMNLFAQYTAKYRNNSNEGRKQLEEVFAHGLPKTAENVKSIRILLASKVTVEEKVMLARILGKQFTPDNHTGMNDAIMQDLKGLSNSGDADIARAATLAYSRLGYFPGHKDVLLSAKNRNLIDSDTYFGELAHVLAFAPANDQLDLINTIRNAKNRYASEIIAMTVNNQAVSKMFYPETRAVIAIHLEELEPSFSQALGQFDYIDAVRYSSWLRAVANMKSSEFNKQGNELIMTRLNDEKTDPRKIMAFLTSEYGPQLMLDIGQRSRFEVILQRISLYSKQLPQNRDMREMVEHVKATLANLQS